MHALIIRTDLLKTHQIRLDEHCFYVDVEYVLFPVPYVGNRCILSGACLYVSSGTGNTKA